MSKNKNVERLCARLEKEKILLYCFIEDFGSSPVYSQASLIGIIYAHTTLREGEGAVIDAIKLDKYPIDS